MRANPGIVSFNAGELSPLLGARPDLEKYQAGLKSCVNMIPRIQGAAQRRAGSLYASAIKDETGRAWLARFVFSQTDAFVLEFGDYYVRFFRNRGVLTTGAVAAWDIGSAYEVGDMVTDVGVTYYATAAGTGNAPPDADYWAPMAGDTYEIPSPYALADLTREDGSFALCIEQSGDILYIAAKGYQPRTLTRFSNVKWVFAIFEPEGGPFKDPNKDEDVTVTVSGSSFLEGETVTISASADIFLTGHERALFQIEMLDGSNVKAWQVHTKSPVGAVRQSDGKYYICTQVGAVNTTDKPAVSGDEKPIHTKGKYWDGPGEEQKGDGNVGSIGVEWEFMHAGYGWVRIATVTDAQTVDAVVLSRLPAELATVATHRWQHAAWSDVEGWPDRVCFFRERLSWFRDQKVWHSVSGDFGNFRAKEFGEVRADLAVSISVQSADGNPIAWVMPQRSRLFLGTNGGEHALGSQTNQQAYGPGNTQQDPVTGWGGLGVRPILIGDSVVFVEKSGRRLRMLRPADNGDGFTADDLNKFHGLVPGGIIDMAWQQTPHEVLWSVTSSGALRGMTIQQEDKVAGWHRHELGGAGAVESVAVIPSPDGARDDVWLIVRRTIDGQTRRYVEYLGEEYDSTAGHDRALISYFDASVIYSGAATTTLSGLDHLEGETVSVLVNGAAHPDREVSSGAITLARSATKAVVGLAAPWNLKIMPLEAGNQIGTSQAKAKRIHRLYLRLLESLGGATGPDFGETDDLEFRLAGEAMDAPPDLFTGDILASFPGGYRGDLAIAIEGSGGFPFTLLGLYPELETNES